MGMSSSQARLLNLTARMHQIEYKAAKLEAQKLQMANQSTKVYNEYLSALDATKIQYSALTTDGSITYIDATYNNLIAAGYQLIFADEVDTVVIDEETYANYVEANGNLNYFIALESGRVTEASQVVTDDDGTEWTEIYTADQLANMSSTGNYRLMSDIDLTGYDWTSISSFSGTLDGNGYTISGLTSALFNKLSGASVSNLYVDGNITFDGDTYTGILANYIGNSTVSDVAISGSITGTDSSGSTSCNVGSLAGFISCSDISTVSSSADIDIETNYATYLRVGGIAGCIHGTSTSYASYSDWVYTGNVNVTSTADNISTSGGIFAHCEYCNNNSDGSSQTIETTVTIDDTISSEYSVSGATTASAVYAAIKSGNYMLDTDSALRSMLEGHEDDTEWLTTMINEGYLYIYVIDSDGELVQTSVSTDTGLQEVTDEVALKKAEAKYEADMKKIDLKDTKYDTDLAAIETEREAIESEIDTLKTVANDNVERTFKLFS